MFVMYIPNRSHYLSFFAISVEYLTVYRQFSISQLRKLNCRLNLTIYKWSNIPFAGPSDLPYFHKETYEACHVITKRIS